MPVKNQGNQLRNPVLVKHVLVASARFIDSFAAAGKRAWGEAASIDTATVVLFFS